MCIITPGFRVIWLAVFCVVSIVPPNGNHHTHMSKSPGTLLLTWINFDPSMDKWSHVRKSVGCNYLSIPKLQSSHRWSFGMDKSFHSTVWEWISNVIPRFMMQLLTHAEIKVNPCCKTDPEGPYDSRGRFQLRSRPKINQTAIEVRFSYTWVNLTHWEQDEMAAILQTTFPDAFFSMKKCGFPISLKYIPRGPNNNNPALLQIKAGHRTGAKPLSEHTMAMFTDAYTDYSTSMSWFTTGACVWW